MMPTVVSSESAPHDPEDSADDALRSPAGAAPDRSKATGAEPPNAVSGAIPCSIDGTSVPAMRSPGLMTKPPSGSPPTVSRSLTLLPVLVR